MNAPAPPRCALAQFATTEREPEERKHEIEEMKRDGYNMHDILVINLKDPGERISPIEMQVFRAYGNRRYGGKGRHG